VANASGLRRLLAAYDALRTAPAIRGDAEREEAAIAPFRDRFFAALDDDMNTASAVSVLFDLSSEAGALAEAGAASRAAAFLHEAMGLLGISPAERAKRGETQTLGAEFAARLREKLGDALPLGSADAETAIAAVIEARNAARAAKDFALADRLRVALAESGVTLADSKEGTTWTAAV
jgi:cysteinyl-tRNA synthetase